MGILQCINGLKTDWLKTSGPWVSLQIGYGVIGPESKAVFSEHIELALS